MIINYFPKVWVLTDQNLENISQVIGVAEALKLPYIEKKIIFNCFAALPNYLKGKKTLNVNLEESDDILSSRPNIIISAGRKLAVVNRYLKNLHPTVFSINCMIPNLNLTNFDLNILSEYDNVKETNNVIQICGTVNQVNKYFLFNEKLKWERQLSHLKKKKISLFIGDGTCYSPYKISHLKQLLSLANELAIKEDASLLIIANKRADFSIKNLVKHHIGCSHYFYEGLQSNNDENPHNGFLAVADIHIGTADSITICSEIVSTGKPSFIYFAEEILQFKHKFFIRKIFKENYARPFNDQILSLDLNNLKLNVLNEGERIASNVMTEYQKFFARTRREYK